MPQIPPRPKTIEAPRILVETYDTMTRAAAAAASSDSTQVTATDTKKEAR